jgi:hypothetical protein
MFHIIPFILTRHLSYHKSQRPSRGSFDSLDEKPYGNICRKRASIPFSLARDFDMIVDHLGGVTEG